MMNASQPKSPFSITKRSPTKPVLKKSPKKPLKLASPTQKSGATFEARACEFLQHQGLTLIAQNWQQPKVGEIDLIILAQNAHDNLATLVFIEVRRRRASNFGNAAMSVSTVKQKKIIKTAQYFLQQHPEFADCDCRFDVVAFDGQNLTPDWIVAAFLAQAW